LAHQLSGKQSRRDAQAPSNVAGPQAVLGRMTDAMDVDYHAIDREQDAVNAPPTAIEQFPKVDSQFVRLVRPWIAIRGLFKGGNTAY
jgi:hypothetical protein